MWTSNGIGGFGTDLNSANQSLAVGSRSFVAISILFGSPGTEIIYINGSVDRTWNSNFLSYDNNTVPLSMGGYATAAEPYQGVIHEVLYVPSVESQATVVSHYNLGIQGMVYNTSDLWWRYDEGSGSVVYGYDDSTALTATPTARLISQTASAVNSSIIFTDTYPLGNSTDRYSNATGYSYRWNSSAAFVMQYLHEVYDIFGVSPSTSGMVNVTTGWYTTLSPFSVLATPYIGSYFQYWERDSVIEGSANPGIVAVTGNHNYTAVFGSKPPSAIAPSNGSAVPFSPFVWLGIVMGSLAILRMKWRPETTLMLSGVVIALQVVGGALIMSPWTALSMMNDGGVQSIVATSYNVTAALGTVGQLMLYCLVSFNIIIFAMAMLKMFRAYWK